MHESKPAPVIGQVRENVFIINLDSNKSQSFSLCLPVSLSLRPPHPPLGAMYHPTQSTNVEIHNLTGEKYHTHYSNLFFLMVSFHNCVRCSRNMRITANLNVYEM